jgi:hypothetical protein
MSRKRLFSSLRDVMAAETVQTSSASGNSPDATNSNLDLSNYTQTPVISTPRVKSKHDQFQSNLLHLTVLALVVIAGFSSLTVLHNPLITDTQTQAKVESRSRLLVLKPYRSSNNWLVSNMTLDTSQAPAGTVATTFNATLKMELKSGPKIPARSGVYTYEQTKVLAEQGRVKVILSSSLIEQATASVTLSPDAKSYVLRVQGSIKNPESANTRRGLQRGLTIAQIAVESPRAEETMLTKIVESSIKGFLSK